ncbi:hypothetical protein A6D94_16960 [Vibrio splendidus]|nr:hypothetical protein A6D94_16960 [Vibrio splendidus]
MKSHFRQENYPTFGKIKAKKQSKLLSNLLIEGLASHILPWLFYKQQNNEIDIKRVFVSVSPSGLKPRAALGLVDIKSSLHRA